MTDITVVIDVRYFRHYVVREASWVDLWGRNTVITEHARAPLAFATRFPVLPTDREPYVANGPRKSFELVPTTDGEIDASN